MLVLHMPSDLVNVAMCNSCVGLYNLSYVLHVNWLRPDQHLACPLKSPAPGRRQTVYLVLPLTIF